MDKILQLFNEDYVVAYLRKKVLPLYPDFKDVEKTEIIAHKKNVWAGETYHVVIEFRTKFIRKDGKQVELPIFCSAHSDEPRKNVYDALKFLWENGFAKGNLSIPHALFYSDYFVGTFYRGVEGTNLYHYIRADDHKNIDSIVPKAAQWFAKLHNLDTRNAKNFNKENSRIETVFPGIEHTIKRIKRDYPDYGDVFEEIFSIVNKKEKEFLASTDQRWLTHGDAHPENIIKMSDKKIAVIDFTDLCLSDFARDLGAFLQQLEFMMLRKVHDRVYINKTKDLFLSSYFKFAKIKLDKDIEARINNYYYWTAMRTATYFMIKANPEPERAFGVVCQVCKDLKIKTDYSKIC